MKRKIVRIILIVVGILVIIVAAMGIFMYNFTQGSENISGKQEAIPQMTKTVDFTANGGSDWLNWQGEHFDRKSSFRGIKEDWSKGLKKFWEVNYLCQGDQTASWSAPVVKGKVLIVPGRDETRDLVFCLDAETGELVWEGSYEAETNTNHGPGARATPSIDGDRVYTLGRSGDLVCWNLADGKMLWHKKPTDIGGVEPDWGYSSSPLILGDKVIIQAGGKALAVAYDKLSGEVKWVSGTGPGGYAPLTFLEADSTIILFSGEALSGINPETGEIYWTLPWMVDYKVNASMPVADGNVLFVTSGYGKGCMAVNVRGKKANVLWESKSMEGQHTDPVIVDGYVYGYSGNSSSNRGALVCLRLSDGREMWKSGEAGNGTFAFADGHLICLDIKGNLYLVEANNEKFIKKGVITKAMPDVNHPAWTTPVIANGKLYLRYLQNIICYNITM